MLMMPYNPSWYALARNDSQRGNNEKRILKTLENDYKTFVEDEKLVDIDLDKVSQL